MRNIIFNNSVLVIFFVFSIKVLAANPEQAFPGQTGSTDTVFVSDGAFKNAIIEYEVINGYMVFEGDIILGTSGTSGPSQQGVVTTVAGARWPGGIISYFIDGANANTVDNAINHWEANTGFQFNEVSSNFTGDSLRFTTGAGCSSWVGRQGGVQDVWLGPACTIGNAIHEIGHAIGFWHEHTRIDRNNFIQINWDNIQANREGNFEQPINAVDIGNYDFGSIMHYPLNAFSRNGLNTITPTVNPPPGVVIGQRNGLSAIDINTAGELMIDPIITLTTSGNTNSHGRFSVQCMTSGDSCEVRGNRSHHSGPRTCSVECEFGEPVLFTCTANNDGERFVDDVRLPEGATVISSSVQQKVYEWPARFSSSANCSWTD